MFAADNFCFFRNDFNFTLELIPHVILNFDNYDL